MNIKTIICNYISYLFTGYNHEKYWKMHYYYANISHSKIIRRYYWFKLNRMEGKNLAYLGHFNFGDCPVFKSAPNLPHQLKCIYISPLATIGENVTIFQEVTIGVKSLSDFSAPKIGDNVTICAGAKIIGDITVGNNVIIGANSVVVKDIPSGCTVVGNPARIIKQ